MSQEHKYDILSLPFALVWQFSILMLPLLVIVRQYRSSAVVGAMLAVALTGLYFFSYGLPPDRRHLISTRLITSPNWYLVNCSPFSRHAIHFAVSAQPEVRKHKSKKRHQT